MPAKFTVATGSCRYIGEIAWNIAVCNTPAEQPSRIIAATRHQEDCGGEASASSKNDAEAPAQAIASAGPTPFHSSKGVAPTPRR